MEQGWKGFRIPRHLPTTSAVGAPSGVVEVGLAGLTWHWPSSPRSKVSAGWRGGNGSGTTQDGGRSASASIGSPWGNCLYMLLKRWHFFHPNRCWNKSFCSAHTPVLERSTLKDTAVCYSDYGWNKDGLWWRLGRKGHEEPSDLNLLCGRTRTHHLRGWPSVWRTHRLPLANF